MTNNIIVFDLETTGLPITPKKWGSYHNPSETNYYDNCRVVQIGVVSEREQHVWFIKPEGFEITNSSFHGITQDIAENGVEWDKMIVELMEIFSRYDKIVGHNILFDINVFASELYRRGCNSTAMKFCSIPYECTMYQGRLFMQSPKVPRLIALYEHLFGEQVIQKHDALEDCCITFDCYVKMLGLDIPKRYHQGIPHTTILGNITTQTSKGVEYGTAILQDFFHRMRITDKSSDLSTDLSTDLSSDKST